MILLLTGSSELVRTLLMEEFLEKFADWTHLSLEELETNFEKGEQTIFGEELMVLLACECAREVMQAGLNVAITCSSSKYAKTIQEAIPQNLVSIYLGAKGRRGGSFDHTIDTGARSLRDAAALLEEIASR